MKRGEFICPRDFNSAYLEVGIISYIDGELYSPNVAAMGVKFFNSKSDAVDYNKNKGTSWDYLIQLGDDWHAIWPVLGPFGAYIIAKGDALVEGLSVDLKMRFLYGGT